MCKESEIVNKTDSGHPMNTQIHAFATATEKNDSLQDD